MSIRKTTDDWKLVKTGQQENLNLANQYLESAAESADPLQVGVAETQRASQAQTVATVDQQVQLAERGEPGTQTNSPPTSVEVTPLTRDTIPRRNELIVETTIQIPGEATETPPIPRQQADLGELGINTDLPTGTGGLLEDAPFDEFSRVDTQVAAVAREQADLGELGINTDLPVPRDITTPFDEFARVDTQAAAVAREQADLGELGINTDLPVPRDITTVSDDFTGVDQQVAAVAREQADLGELGINTDLPAGTPGGPAVVPITGGVQQATNSNIATRDVKGIDWRFRISLSNEANYLYMDESITFENSLLYPLKATNGVLFPYTPKVDVTYTANYDATEIVHSNYKFYNYRNSSVENLSITGDFTAQDTYEANYMLAVIHFFRSVTKMFYGKDNDPRNGIPPPLCYINGHGTYAFNNHPCVITSFTLNYPSDVDYVNARIPIGTLQGAPTYNKPVVGPPSRVQRLLNLSRTGVNTGGVRASPIFRTPVDNTSELTRVPSKLSITIQALPVVTRNDLSNNFSLREYATGALLLPTRKKLTAKKSVGGFW
jgi:hypothetical protein